MLDLRGLQNVLTEALAREPRPSETVADVHYLALRRGIAFLIRDVSSRDHLGSLATIAFVHTLTNPAFLHDPDLGHRAMEHYAGMAANDVPEHYWMHAADVFMQCRMASQSQYVRTVDTIGSHARNVLQMITVHQSVDPSLAASIRSRVNAIIELAEYPARSPRRRRVSEVLSGLGIMDDDDLMSEEDYLGYRPGDIE